MKKTLVAVASSLSLFSCGIGTCIARGTLVSTPRGKRRIEDLVEQDTVWCVDPLTAERVASPITAIRRSKREVMRLEGADFSLRCTTDHPLYDPMAKAWAPAGDWVLGKRTALLLARDEQAARVVSVERRIVADGVDEVFDLTVQHELHNFVASDVLVHNKSPIYTCPGADGGALTEGSTCTVQNGDAGYISCDPVDGGALNAVCKPYP